MWTCLYVRSKSSIIICKISAKRSHLEQEMAEIWKQIKVLPASYAPEKLLGQFYMDIIYIFQLQHLIYHMFLAETAVQNPAKQSCNHHFTLPLSVWYHYMFGICQTIPDTRQ